MAASSAAATAPPNCGTPTAVMFCAEEGMSVAEASSLNGAMLGVRRVVPYHCAVRARICCTLDPLVCVRWRRGDYGP